MKSLKLLTFIFIFSLCLTACAKTKAVNAPPLSITSVEEEPEVVEEPAIPVYYETESNENGTHTIYLIDGDTRVVDAIESCEFDESGTCAECGYTAKSRAYGFEELEIRVWTRVNTQWGLYAAPDKNSEKVTQTNGIEELHAIGIGIYNDIEWYCIEKDGVVGYLETKKLDTEEPLMTQLEEANESGEITFDENVQYFYGFKEDLITKESIHAGENCPYDMYVLQYDDNGEPFCYAPSTADLGVFSNKSINKIFNSHIGVFTGFGELPYDSTWKDMTVIRVYFDHN